MLEGLCGVLSFKYNSINMKSYLFDLYNAIKTDLSLSEKRGMKPSNTSDYAVYALTT